MSRFLFIVALVLLVGFGLWTWRTSEAERQRDAVIRAKLQQAVAATSGEAAPTEMKAKDAAATTTTPLNPVATLNPPAVISEKVAAADAEAPADPPVLLAEPLNSPKGTIGADLDTVRIVLEAWRSNFPHEGNPVGENAEITAALTGKNPLKIALIPKNHPAINAEGQLCDRWGTPFHFHQISGDRMELRSAGPDRQFGTIDDALLAPP